MSWIKSLAAVAALGVGTSLFVAPVMAQDKPAQPANEKPGEKKPEKKPMGPRLVQPWSWLTTLSDEQKTKIAEIHKKAVDDMAQIRAQEEKDITALLTDEQKKELATRKEEEAAKRKKPNVEKDGEKKPEAEKRDELRNNMEVKPMPAPAPGPDNGM